MGHYWSEMRPDPTPEESEAAKRVSFWRPRIREEFSGLPFDGGMTCSTCYAFVKGTYIDIDNLVGHIGWHERLRP